MSRASRCALSLSVALVLSACQSPVAVADSADGVLLSRAAAAPVHIVSIAGKLDLSAYDLPDETYAMTAHKDADGNVRGSIVVRLSDPVVSFQGEVTCLQVQDDLAWVGVQVTKSDATLGTFAEGGTFWFRVQDNGEGANAAADRISFLNPAGGAARCNEKRTGLGLAFEMQGNVQIR